MDQFNLLVNNNLSWVHENKYVFHTLSLFLGMYAALARPKLPTFIAKLFENPFFRIVVISYIVYRGNKDPQLSIMIATAFLVTIHMINKTRVENFASSCGDAGKLSCQCPDPFGGPCPVICNKQREDFTSTCGDAGKLSCQCPDPFGGPCPIICNKQREDFTSTCGNAGKLGCQCPDPHGGPCPVICNKQREDFTSTCGNAGKLSCKYGVDDKGNCINPSSATSNKLRENFTLSYETMGKLSCSCGPDNEGNCICP